MRGAKPILVGIELREQVSQQAPDGDKMLAAHSRLLSKMPTDQLPLPRGIAERELPVLRFGHACGTRNGHRLLPPRDGERAATPSIV
jgi:hypothetical protein